LIGQNLFYFQPQFLVWYGLEPVSNYRLVLNYIDNENHLTFYVNFAFIGQNQFYLNIIFSSDMGSSQTKN